MERREETGRIIAAAIAVHRALGPGFVESVYENALALELEARRIAFERQPLVPIVYRGIVVGEHRLDLLVGRSIVVELKSVREIFDAHFAIARSYLRAVGVQHGLLLNFSKPKLEAKRVIAPPLLLPACLTSSSSPRAF